MTLALNRQGALALNRQSTLAPIAAVVTVSTSAFGVTSSSLGAIAGNVANSIPSHCHAHARRVRPVAGASCDLEQNITRWSGNAVWLSAGNAADLKEMRAYWAAGPLMLRAGRRARVESESIYSKGVSLVGIAGVDVPVAVTLHPGRLVMQGSDIRVSSGAIAFISVDTARVNTADMYPVSGVSEKISHQRLLFDAKAIRATVGQRAVMTPTPIDLHGEWLHVGAGMVARVDMGAGKLELTRAPLTSTGGVDAQIVDAALTLRAQHAVAHTGVVSIVSPDDFVFGSRVLTAAGGRSAIVGPFEVRTINQWLNTTAGVSSALGRRPIVWRGRKLDVPRWEPIEIPDTLLVRVLGADLIIEV